MKLWQEIAEEYKGKDIQLVSGPCPTPSKKRWETEMDWSETRDTVWSNNGLWFNIPECTLGFEMHDFGGPSFDAHPNKKWYLEKLRTSTIPVFMPHAHPDFPGVVEFPLDEVVARFKVKYFGESTNYMIAFAILAEAESITLALGFDHLPGSRVPGERASSEFWCGIAHMSGVRIIVPEGATALRPDQWEYFYDPRAYGYKREPFKLVGHKAIDEE